jgi:hypothetical protein
MAISKPVHGTTGWDTATDAVIDQLNAVAPNNLTGTASSSTYLRGDSAWSGVDGGHITSGTVPYARLPTGTAASTVAIGDHTHAGAAPATQTGVTGTATVNCQTNNAHALTLSGNVTSLTVSGTPTDGQRLVIEAWSPTSSRTFTHGLARMTGLDTVLTIGTNQVCLLGLYYSTRASRWILASFNEEA